MKDDEIVLGKKGNSKKIIVYDEFSLFVKISEKTWENVFFFNVNTYM
jgi:hypothetical protein